MSYIAFQLPFVVVTKVYLKFRHNYLVESNEASNSQGKSHTYNTIFC